MISKALNKMIKLFKEIERKKILFAMIFTTLLFSNLTSEAVLLPHNMQVYTFTNAIGASIRFDGLINFAKLKFISKTVLKSNS